MSALEDQNKPLGAMFKPMPKPDVMATDRVVGIRFSCINTARLMGYRNPLELMTVADKIYDYVTTGKIPADHALTGK